MIDRSSVRHVARRPVVVLVVILLLGAGANVRTPDRATCRSVMRPPLLFEAGGAAVHRLCARTR